MTEQSAPWEISDPDRLIASPLVSVYMLAYKHERFIEEAIKGVLMQRTNFPYELIIGEDRSPDRTLEIATSYQAKHPEIIRIITSPGNVGAHKNAYRCRMATRGKYIAICEGDDFWHNSTKLQAQVDLMEIHPDMALCHTDFNRCTRFRTKRSVHRNSHIPPAQGNAYNSLLCNWTVMTATSMYRRDVVMDFMNTEFYTHRWPFGDRNLLLYSSLRGKIGYIDESTATFRRTRGSATNSGNMSRLRMALATQECVEMFLERYPVPVDVSRKARVRLKEETLRYAFLQGDTEIMESCTRWLAESGGSQSVYSSRLFRALAGTKPAISLFRKMKQLLDDMASDQ